MQLLPLRSGCLCIQCLRKAVRQAEGQSDCFGCMYCYRELHSGSVCCPCAAVQNEHVALWRDTDIVQRMAGWLACICTVRLLAEGAFFGRDQHACGIATFKGICHNKDAISIV